jgi:hypothetical protein
VKLKELEKRLEKEPGNLGLKVTVAGLLHESGRTVDAVELYRSVALAYRDAGRKQQAVAVCKSILELAPHDEQCRGLLASLTAPPPPERVPTPVPAPRPRLTPAPPIVPAQAPPGEPKRRSSLDETPLPKPVPHHVVDPTTGAQRISAGELIDGDPTRPDGAAPRSTVDLAAELETRPRKKIDAAELSKISQPLPTVPVERVDIDEDSLTPVRDSDLITRPRDKLPEED